MKRKGTKVAIALSALFLLGGPLFLTACGPTDNPGPVGPIYGDGDVLNFDVELSSTKSISVGEYINVVATVTEVEQGATNVVGEFIYESEDPSIADVDSNGRITGVKAGTTTISVICDNFGGEESNRTKTIQVTVSGDASNATGAFNYSGASYEEKLDILGKLEDYALNNNLTGITLFENGGYVMYADRIQKGTEQYISGYGFGIVSEGTITAPNKNYEADGTENYYHSYGGVTNSQRYNYLDDTGSESADLYGYVANSYYGTRMNSTKDGYEWYPALAKTFPNTDPYYSSLNLNDTQLNRPVALNKDSSTGLATQFRIYFKTGYDYADGKETLSGKEVAGDGFAYHTSTSSNYYDDYDGRPVSIMDYVTPYMLLLNQGIGLARSTDMISDSSDGTLKGARSFYNATATNTDLTSESVQNQFFNLVGIDVGLDDDPSSLDAPCITFTLNRPLSEFSAMYSLSSTLVSPIPLDFIIDIATKGETNGEKIVSGMKDSYGVSNSVNNTTPVDNLLSAGPYILERSSAQEAVYSRNADFVTKFETGRYNIEGLVLHYLPSMGTNSNSAFLEFLDDNLDAASIPKDYINQYRGDTRTTVTQGDSTFKLNVNSCTQEEWNAIFGPNGSNPNGGLNYTIEPLMSNDKFVQALSYAIDRETFAANRGNVPSQDYFADAYMWEPEQGYSYNDTPQHLANLADRSPSTYGYNLDVAVSLMDQAIQEEINKGTYDGMQDSATIEISWMNTTDARDFGDEILTYWREAFELTDAARAGFNLVFTQDNGATDYQQVYTKMRQGQFDIGFGSISGMNLDPLGFMEVLKSNNEAGFTLNYSGDTSVISNTTPIYYDGKKWSYDALWEAANNGAIIGSDTKLVENPVSITQTGSERTDWLGTPSMQLALRYQKNVNAAGAQIRLATNDEEQVTISGNYSHRNDSGETETVNVTFNLNLAKYGQVNGGDSTSDFEDGESELNTIDIYIPLTLTTEMTYLDYEVNLTDLTNVVVYVNLYTTIEGMTVSSTYTIPESGSISWNK